MISCEILRGPGFYEASNPDISQARNIRVEDIPLYKKP